MTWGEVPWSLQILLILAPLGDIHLFSKADPHHFLAETCDYLPLPHPSTLIPPDSQHQWLYVFKGMAIHWAGFIAWIEQ